MFLIYLTSISTLFLIWSPNYEATDNIVIPYIWRNIEFLYPVDADRTRSLQDGSYIIDNAVLNDVDVWEGKNLESS